MTSSNPFSLYDSLFEDYNSSKTTSNGYSLHVEGGETKPRRYIVMRHGQQYKVVMGNQNSTKCQATLKIDGINMGTFLINPHQTISIERPLHRHKLFTFYETNKSYPSSFQTGIIPGNRNNGVIEVTFIPENKIKYQTILDSDPYKSCFCKSNTFLGMRDSYMEGGTGLSGHSTQSFDKTDSLYLDYNKQVTLTVRLVGENKLDYPDVEPLIIKQPVPPPVGPHNVFPERYNPMSDYDFPKPYNPPNLFDTEPTVNYPKPPNPWKTI